MKFLTELLLFGCSFLGVQSFNCPHGSDQVPREDVCMFGVDEHKFYLDASRRCVALGGIAAKIQNIYENLVVFALIPQDVNNEAPYIGVERKENNTWTYADGSPLTYQNWDINQPNNSSNSSICAIMDPQTGKWLSAECAFSRPFFCSINGDDFQCLDGWVYSEKTDYCYFLQNFTYPDAVHWQTYNFTVAEANCQRMNSHLVSIHCKEEDDFVYDLIATNVVNISNAAPANNPCSYQSPRIGYFGNGILGTGTWTDGSPVDYMGTLWPNSLTGPYAITNDESCPKNPVKHWGITGVDSPMARFVCKMPSKNRKEKLMLL